MKVSKAVKIWLDYHRAHSRPSTARAYEQFISTFHQQFGNHEVDDVTANDILEYMNRITEGLKANTIRAKFAYLHAFFNFIRINIDEEFINPCDTKMLRKLFRPREIRRWDILEKEVVDEIIFLTEKPRDRSRPNIVQFAILGSERLKRGFPMKNTVKDNVLKMLKMNTVKGFSKHSYCETDIYLICGLFSL